MVWDVVASVGSNLLGSWLGSKGQEAPEQRQYSVRDFLPEGAQAAHEGYLGDIAGLTTPRYFGGETYAGLVPLQRRAISESLDTRGGLGGDVMRHQMDAGLKGLGQYGSLTGYLGDIQNQGPAQFGLDMGTFNQTMANLMPGLQGQYEEIMRDPLRQYSEQIMPSIALGGALAADGFGSTRRYNQGAIAERGLMDRAADVSTNLWTNAANQAQQAAMRGGELNMQGQESLRDDLIRGRFNAAQMGLPYLGSAYDTGLRRDQQLFDMGRLLQTDEQGRINADMARHEFEQTVPWDTLGRRFDLYNTGVGSTAVANTPAYNQVPWYAAPAADAFSQGAGLLGDIDWSNLLGGNEQQPNLNQYTTAGGGVWQ